VRCHGPVRSGRGIRGAAVPATALSSLTGREFPDSGHGVKHRQSAGGRCQAPRSRGMSARNLGDEEEQEKA
jgi:hypothetical protein